MFKYSVRKQQKGIHNVKGASPFVPSVCLSTAFHVHIISRMNVVLEARIRAAGAEMNKPGRWRVALEQLGQATTQVLTASELDKHAAALTLETLQALYQ